jgi:predicted nucleic acid-binding Zn ribbon protein
MSSPEAREGRSGGRRTRSPGTASLEPVGASLKNLLEKLGLSKTLKGWEALNLWKEVVGEPAALRSRAIAFEAGRLIVEVDGAAWSSQLFILRREIRTRLNDRLGGEVVQEIQFMPARGGRG